MSSTTTTTTLQAIYTAPDQQSHTFTHPIAAPLPAASSSPSSTDPAHVQTKTKTTYLASLRQTVPALQTAINVFLTEKMEDDKKAADAQGRHLSEKEAKEEANYGEEVVDEEEDA